MLIQKDLEAKVTAAISSALTTAQVDGCEVRGTWATANSGLIRWIENPSNAAPAFISVSMASPSWQTFTTPVVDFACRISLFVRPELDTEGTKLIAVSEIIENLLRDWITNASIAWTALDLEALSVDGVSLGGGDAPTVTNGVCAVSWSLNLTGSYKPTTTTL